MSKVASRVEPSRGLPLTAGHRVAATTCQCPVKSSLGNLSKTSRTNRSTVQFAFGAVPSFSSEPNLARRYHLATGRNDRLTPLPRITRQTERSKGEEQTSPQIDDLMIG